MEKEKKPEHESLAEPQKDYSSKLKDCSHKHNMKRTIVCNECRSLLCPKCSAQHIKIAHGVDMVSVEEAVAKPAEITIKNADEYKARINIIKNEQRGLKNKAARIMNDNYIEELKQKAIMEINDIVKKANVEKKDW